jgi:D-inositol-3-phosphate glycosyltransferase
MKIALISPAHPLRGGIAALSERLALELQSAGHQVEIYSFSLQYPDFLFPGKTQYTDGPPPQNLTIRTRLNSINPFNWWVVGRELAKAQPDRVIVRYWLPLMGPCLGTVLRVMRWFHRGKPQVTALTDNIIPHEKRPGDWWFSKYFTGACDDFLVMSRSVGEEIRQFTDKPVRFSPHPVYDNYGERIDQSAARQQLNLPQNTPLVLFFGFIRAYKGLDLLLEALAQVPTVHLVVAGECYEPWDRYAALIQEHQLEDRVHLFTDFIPDEAVRQYFSATDLVVQPYKTATQSGISQIAYHFNQPMLVTRVGGLPEIVTDGVSGYVTLPEPAAIAAAIRDFFENNRAAAMTQGVLKEKERFSWGAFVRNLLG